MTHSQPLVSIITPVYNGSRWIEELITSVREQDYGNIEHIVIDDGSSDNGATVEILGRYPHLRWWSRKNKGQYATLNEGLAESRGELVTIICADDLYASPTAISRAVSLWDRDRNFDAVYGEHVLIDEYGKEVDGFPPRGGPISIFRHYPGVCTHCSLLITRRFIFDHKIFFDESYKYSGDYDWIVRLIRSSCRFRRLRLPIAKYRVHQTQLSRDPSPARRAESRRLIELYGKRNPCVAFLVSWWCRLTRLKNLCLRRGLDAGFHEIYGYFRRRVSAD